MTDKLKMEFSQRGNYLMRIISNKVVCLLCNDEIESETVDRLVSCECGRVSISGGLERLDRSGIEYVAERSRWMVCYLPVNDVEFETMHPFPKTKITQVLENDIILNDNMLAKRLGIEVGE